MQLSTTMTKEFGTADPVYLAATDFVIVSNSTTIGPLTEADLVDVLKFKRKQDNEGEGRGTYDYEVTVNTESAFMTANPGVTIVATNTGRITITEKALENGMIGDIDGVPFTFKAAAWEPKPDVMNGLTKLVENKDFTYSWENNTNAGTGKVKIIAKAGGNYSGTAEKTFTIDKKAIAADKLSIAFTNEYTYTGAAIEPEVTVKDMSLGESGTQLANTDFSVAYAGKTDATLAEGETYLNVSAQAAGNYTFDAVNKNFTINKAPLTISIPAGQKKVFGDPNPALVVEYDAFVGGETADALVTAGKFVKPTLTRVPGENAGVYAISITNAADVVAGARNYAVTISDATVNFSIQAKDLATATLTLTDKVGDTYIYNGEQHFKNVSVAFGANPPLAETNYTVTTTNNINAGTGVNGALVTVTGIGNYKGTLTANFDIAKAGIKIIPAAATKSYGIATDPALTYTLKVGDETVPNKTLKGTVTLQREVGETVGAYNIWFKSYEAGEGDNYAPENTDVMADEVTAGRSALFTITGMEGTLYLKFKSTAVNTKEYGAANPTWTIEDLEVDTEKGGLTCDDWDAVKYTFGDPAFAIASENVKDNATNKVSVTNVLSSPIYPTVEVGTMPFTITARPIEVTLTDQAISYGDALGQINPTNWSITDGTLATGDNAGDLGILVKTVNAQNTYAVSATAYEDAITAEITNDVHKLNYDLTTVNADLTVNATAGIAMRSVYADADDDEFATIKAFNDKNVNVTITINRTQELASGKKYIWKGEEWNAFILPFDITPKELSEKFGYAIVNVVNPAATSGNNVAFKLQMSGTIAANTPFMLKNYQAVPENTVIDFGSREIKAPTSAEVSVDANTTGDIKFIGSYNTKTINNTNSNLYYYNGEGAWKHLGASSSNTWNIAPFNAYIETPATVGAQEFTFTFEELNGDITAIRSISEDATGTNVKGWYNLNGMKMENAPTQKGVYIKDGKKVLIK